MKNFKILSVLSVCVVLGLSAWTPADAQSIADQWASEHEVYLDMDKKILSKPLAGEAEEGVLELFVKKQVANDFDDPSLAESLNNITPAAGVQFRVEF